MFISARRQLKFHSSLAPPPPTRFLHSFLFARAMTLGVHLSVSVLLAQFATVSELEIGSKRFVCSDDDGVIDQNVVLMVVGVLVAAWDLWRAVLGLRNGGAIVEEENVDEDEDDLVV